MTTASKLQQELENTFLGKPWFGTPIATLITQGSWLSAFTVPANALHSVAHLILHMTGWTEEVISRLQGNTAGDPIRGDWPEPGAASEQKWQQMVIDLDEANGNLIKAIQAFPDDKWGEKIDDQRGVFEPVPTYKELVYGLIQHQIYHAGQIAFLNRMNHVN
jgi:uncharacterized damage-inducible protein DinB